MYQAILIAVGVSASAAGPSSAEFCTSAFQSVGCYSIEAQKKFREAGLNLEIDYHSNHTYRIGASAAGRPSVTITDFVSLLPCKGPVQACRDRIGAGLDKVAKEIGDQIETLVCTSPDNVQHGTEFGGMNSFVRSGGSIEYVLLVSGALPDDPFSPDKRLATLVDHCEAP